MNEYNKTPISGRIVRFQDCDPYGHLNNGKYIDYLLNAREDHLSQEYGIDVFAMATNEKKSWLVGQNNIVYLRPSRVMEEVLIRSALIDYGDRFITAEMVMTDKEERQLKAVLWTRFFYFDFEKGIGIRHDEEKMKLFGELKIDGDFSDLTKRAKSLARNLKSEL